MRTSRPSSSDGERLDDGEHDLADWRGVSGQVRRYGDAGGRPIFEPATAKSVVICSLMPTAVPPMKGGRHGTPLPRCCKVARTAAARLTTAYVLV